MVSITRRPEPLVHRYYGLMLGFFLHLLRLEVPAAIYESHRARINEVMCELEVLYVLPETHSQFTTEFDSLVTGAITELKLSSTELADFFAFGFHALRLLAGLDADDPVRDVIREDFADITRSYGLDADAIESVVQDEWHAGHVDEALWTELVGRFYRLATIAIWPLQKQAGVCFVIMPFSDPFRGYYLDFYRPALRVAGYESIRAWVGLTNEAYLPLLATLISRCSAALADVSAEGVTGFPNLNVIHEIGLNMALESATFLIRNQDDVKIPSNFTGRAILEYDARVPEFPESKAEEVGALLQVE